MHADAKTPAAATLPGEPVDIVFVTGASRSGTSMLSRMLGNHSHVLSFSELHFFGDLCSTSRATSPLDDAPLMRLATDLSVRLSRGIWNREITPADRARAVDLCNRLEPSQRTAIGVFSAMCAEAASSAGKRVVCEQTPRNIFYADLILEALPGARIVHMVRDPRAVVASQKNRWQLRRLGAGNSIPAGETIRTWLNYHPITMARLWKHATQRALELEQHPRVRLLRFEDVVSNPRDSIADLCRFLGLSFEESMPAVPQWGSSNMHHGRQVGVTSAVVNRWRQVLDAGEMGIVESIALSPMQRFEYAPLGSRTTKMHLLALRYLLSFPLHLLGVLVANPRRAWIQGSALLRRQNV